MARKKTATRSKTARRTRHAKSTTARDQTNVQDPLALVARLMSIPGQSGEEGKVAAFIQHSLRQAGARKRDFLSDTAHRRSPFKGEVGNLVLQLPGTVKGPRRLLMAHMDTVPVCVGSQPVRKGRFIRSANPATGLGADNRAGVAVVLNTALRVLREKPNHPPLTFLWTVQEEIGLHGARFLKLGMLGSPKLAFNWDGGTPHKVTIGATGGYRMQIRVEGLASHAGNWPERGVSAIAIASLAIADLHENGWHGQIAKWSKRGTSNVGFIQGGNATNVVTDQVLVRAEARSHDPEFRKRIVKEIEQSFRRSTNDVKSDSGKKGKVHFDGRLDYESFRLDETEPSVLAAEQAVRSIGEKPLLFIANGGLDANWMAARGIPTATLGCGQVNPHMPTEALEVAAFNKACRIAWRLATATEGDDDGA